MKNLPKVTLVLTVVNLIIGLWVTISHRELPEVLDLAMPLAFIFAGLAVITRAMQNEMVKFDEDQHQQKSSARQLGVATAGSAFVASDHPVSTGSETASPHKMSAEGLWLRGVTKEIHH